MVPSPLPRLPIFLSAPLFPLSAGLAFYKATNEAWKPLTGNPDTPFVCLKVPTGGGKTLIAAHAAGIVYDRLLQNKGERG